MIWPGFSYDIIMILNGFILIFGFTLATLSYILKGRNIHA